MARINIEDTVESGGEPEPADTLAGPLPPEAVAAANGHDETPEADQPEPDGTLIRKLPNGSTAFTIESADGGSRDTYIVRRPNLRQLETLTLAYEDLADEHTVGAQDLQLGVVERQAAAEAAHAKHEAGDLTRAKLVAEIRKLNVAERKAQRDYTAMTTAGKIGWWRQVFMMLSAKGAPADEDWPSWVLDNRMANRMLVRWREAPLARGW